MRTTFFPCRAQGWLGFVIVFVVAQLRLVLAAQRGELCPPNALDLGLVDKLLLSDVVPVRRLWAILSFRYKSAIVRRGRLLVRSATRQTKLLLVILASLHEDVLHRHPNETKCFATTSWIPLAMEP